MFKALFWAVSRCSLWALGHHFYSVSLKCDLNPVFRRKGALLWPPLHPSPHFHPPCLGRRMKVLKRLSTSSLGLCLVGRSESTGSPLPSLPVPPLLSSICCSLPALLHEPTLHRLPSPPDAYLHQHHPHCAATHFEFCGFATAKHLPERWKLSREVHLSWCGTC